MPVYEYQGVDRSGKKVTGSINAESEGELRMALRSQGVRPTRIAIVQAPENPKPQQGKETAAAGAGGIDILALFGGKPRSTANIRIPTAQVVMFTRQLQVMIGAGIPLVQSLDILAEQQANPSMKLMLIEIRDKVQGGSFLWEAFAGYPKTFSKLYVSLIRAGEASGSLDLVLRRLSRYLEDAERLAKMLRGAMIYPVAVIVIGIGVLAIMLVFVIPKFEEMLTSSGQQLPALTQMVINLSHFVVDRIGIIVGTIAVSGFLIARYLSTEEGRVAKDRLLFRLPLFGSLVQKGGVARFCRTLQSLLSAGVNLIDAVDICKSTINNAVIEDAVSKMRTEVENGKPIGASLAAMGVFPRMAVQMISVGESTGALDKMLEKVSDFYEAEVESAVGGMTKLIEPLVLVFLGGSVATLMIAMYLPIFNMAGAASGGG